MIEVGSVADAATEMSAGEGSNLRIAFASLDGECVDQHFGSAQGFFVYEVGASESRLIASKVFPKEKKDGNEDKLKPRLSWLVGSDLVYCGSVGGSATRQLMALGVTPVVVKAGPDVEDLLAQVQGELSGVPSPLLQRILNSKAPKSESRFDAMEEELWEE